MKRLSLKKFRCLSDYSLSMDDKEHVVLSLNVNAVLMSTISHIEEVLIASNSNLELWVECEKTTFNGTLSRKLNFCYWKFYIFGLKEKS